MGNYKAYRLLKLAHEERKHAYREFRFGRDPNPNLSIAMEYERLASNIIGQEAVDAFIIDNGYLNSWMKKK